MEGKVKAFPFFIHDANGVYAVMMMGDKDLGLSASINRNDG